MTPRPELRLDVFQGMGWMWLGFATADALHQWFGWPILAADPGSFQILVEYVTACWFLFGGHLVDVWLWKRRQRIEQGDANG